MPENEGVFDLGEELDRQVAKSEKFEDFFQAAVDVLILQPLLKFLKDKLIKTVKGKVKFWS